MDEEEEEGDVRLAVVEVANVAKRATDARERICFWFEEEDRGVQVTTADGARADGWMASVRTKMHHE